MKRNYVLLMLVFITFSAGASVQVLRVSDDRSSSCNSLIDQKYNYLGAYRLSEASAKIKDDESVSIRFKLNYLFCQKDANGNFKLSSGSPLREVNVPKEIMIEPYRNIKVITNEAKLVAYKNDIYKPLVTSRLKDSRNQTFEYEFDVSELFSENSLDELHAGEEITTSIDFSLLKKLTFLEQEDVVLTRPKVYFGSYRLVIKLKYENGKIITKAFLELVN